MKHEVKIWDDRTSWLTRIDRENLRFVVTSTYPTKDRDEKLFVVKANVYTTANRQEIF